MLLTLRAQYSAGVTPRAAADAVISALTPAAWYRNATGVTSAGGFASQWDDYSGNARHLVQATGTNQPAYAAGVVSCDGADNYMKVTGGFTLNQPETVIFVGRQDSWTSGDYLFDGNTADKGEAYQDAASPRLRLWAGLSGPITGVGIPAIGSFAILACVFNGASSSVRVNNDAKVTGNAGAANMGGFTLGCAGSTTAFAAASFSEIVIFPSALSDANQDAVITALNNALTVF